jgi:O-succinylbenzoate synthase
MTGDNMITRKIIEPIKRAKILIVRLPLVRPFTTSFGTETHKEALLINLSTAKASGWGESVTSPAPFYSYETNETALWVIKHHLLPILGNQQERVLSDILHQFKRIRGHAMAKAAVENALLDLMARQQNLPLHELIGGARRRIMSGISIGIKDNRKELLETIAGAVDRGYHRIKIKIKKGTDIELIKSIRTAFPKIRLMADANADYTIDDLELFKKLDPFDLMMIEQPLEYNDLYFHSKLQKEIRTPICLDESIKNLNDARAAIEMRSGRIINIKQGRVGGLLAARDIQKHCLKNEIHCWSGGMLETGIGRAFNLHLQTLPGFTLPGDTSETARYFDEDIVDKPVELDEEGFIDIPEGPGTGVEIRPDLLKKYTVHSEHL